MALVNGSSICTTAVCQSLSTQVLQALAPNFTKINACENWDQLVCGGYRLEAELAPKKQKDNVLSKLRKDANAALRDILQAKEPKIYSQDAEAAKAEKENWILVKTSYNACMDEFKAQQNDNSSLIQLYETIFELNTTDPLSPNADILRTPKKETWGMDRVVEQAMMRMSMRDLNPFVSFGPAKSLINPNQTVIAIQPDFTLGMLPEQYLDEKLEKKYRVLMKKIMKQTAPKSLQRRSEFRAGFVFWIEKRLSQMLLDPKEYTDLHQPGRVIQVPIDKLRKHFHYMPMRKLLEAHPVPKGYNMTMVELILPGTLKVIDKLMSSNDGDEKLAYMFWKVFLKTRELWNMPWLKEWKEFQQKVEGREADLTDDVLCLKRVYNQFPDIMDSFYVQQHFSQSEKAAASGILHQIKQTFVSLVNSTTWLSTTAHNATMSKAADISELVGFKEENPNVLDPISVKMHYNGTQFPHKGMNYTDYYFHARNWRLKKVWAALDKPPATTPWHLAASTMNALYASQDNSIAIPAAMLQSPVFDARLPSVANYAALGTIAGHELTHALDGDNRQFDGNGMLETQGWGQRDEKNYNSKAECFESLYDGKKADANSAKVVGSVVLAEAIADSYGAEIAYRAWKSSKGPHNERIIGLEKFTADQLFWVLRSLPYCDVKEAPLTDDTALTQVHPPMKLRNWLPLKNSKAWHESFGCEMKEPACELFGV